MSVVATLARFEPALVKSDAMGDDDSLARAKRFREKTLAEEARLVAVRAELKAAKNSLAAYGIAVHGALVPLPGATSSPKLIDEVALEKKKSMMLKRKLPYPKDG